MGKLVKSRAQRREEFVKRAVEMYDTLEDWYEAHPEASFGEIEQKAREQRRKLMGEALGVLINQRQHKSELNAPRCPKCNAEMELHEIRGKTVHGLEGQTRVERSYYVCPSGCGEAIFPPGWSAAAAA